jgi:hypothetical protein
MQAHIPLRLSMFFHPLGFAKSVCAWPCIFVWAVLCTPLAGSGDDVLSYQGRLLRDGVPFHGTGFFKFALVEQNEPGLLWGNAPDDDGNGEPDASVEVTVVRGLFSVLLGDETHPGMQAIPPSVFQQPDLWLRVWFSPPAGPFEVLLPDQRMASIGRALVAATVAPGGVSLEALAPGVLSAGHLTGVLDEARLPANVARIEPDLRELSDAWTALHAAQANAWTALSNQVQVLGNQLAALQAGGGGGGSGLAGAVHASQDPDDPAFAALGLARFHTFASAGWRPASGVAAPAAVVGLGGVWAAGRAWGVGRAAPGDSRLFRGGLPL